MIGKQIELVRALVHGIRHQNFFPQAFAMTSQITWHLLHLHICALSALSGTLGQLMSDEVNYPPNFER